MYKLITNGKIVTPGKIFQDNIVIEQDGKIKSLGTKPVHPKGGYETTPHGEVFDAKGKYILPGLIEVHGHMREPGMTEKEDVPHGTKSALAGGVTTIIDMPNTNPPTTTRALLEEKIKKIYHNRSYSDYAFFIGASKENLSELEKVDTSSIVGVKIFMAGHETTPTTIPDDETLEKVFAILAKRKMRAAIHAEDQNLINYYERLLKRTGRTDPALWSELRPKPVVVKAVERAIRLAEKYNVSLYLLHLSTREEFNLVHTARKSGLDVYGELVSYQLVFNINDYKKLGNKIKVSPVLRSPNDQNVMWKLFKERKIDVLCSEHAPHEKKLKEQNNVWKAHSGMPNIQETLPALITHWIKRFGENSIEECLKTIAGLSSKNPARIFNFQSKGGIKEGFDADLVIIDVKNPWEVKKKDVLSKCGWSAYEGMKLVGRPIATFLRGNLVYNNGKILGSPKGKWLK